MHFSQQIPVNAEAAVLRRKECSLVPAIGLAGKPDSLEPAMAHGGRLWDGILSGAWLWLLSQQIAGPTALQVELTGLCLVIRG